MKYLITTNYTGFDLDDPENVVNTQSVIGVVDSVKEVINTVNEDFEAYVDDEVEMRVDFDEAEPEEIEEVRNSFEVAIYEQFEAKLNEAVEVGYIYFNNDFNIESYKAYVILLGE